MTSPNPFTPTGGGGTAGAGYLDIQVRQGNPMIVKVWDNPEYVRTANNKDGMVYPKDNGEPFPNRAVRAAIVDLNAIAPDGTPGVLYPESWIQASSLMKEAKKWIGQGVKLVRWEQTGPRDGFGAPDKSAPYTITDLSGDPGIVAQAVAWMQAHPEFDTLQPPAPYDGKPPAPKVEQAQQQPWGPNVPYGQPQPGWNQQPPQQWQPPVPPAQPSAAWNTATPPPEYYQQTPQWVQQQQQQQAAQRPEPGYNAPQIQQYMNQMPPQQPQGPYGQPPAPQGPPQQQYPQQAPQGTPGSFFDASQGQQGPPVPQWQGGFNQQSDTPPF
jgi:hypothetical protein